MVVDAAGNRQHDGDLSFPEAFKLKDKLAGGRKVTSPRIEQAGPVEVLTPLGVPPGVPRLPDVSGPVPGYPKPVDWSSPETVDEFSDEDIPEVAAGANADEDLDRLLKEVGQ